MNGRNLLLLRFSLAIFSVIGAVLGAHMAGAGSYAFRPIRRPHTCRWLVNIVCLGCLLRSFHS